MWDASALLGKYVGREDVWERLTAGKRRDGTRAPTTTLELGAGTGLATLLVASSERASREEGGLVCVMTDLPEVVALARANARENKEENGGRVPNRVLLATRGCGGDGRRMWRRFRRRYGGRTWFWGQI